MNILEENEHLSDVSYSHSLYMSKMQKPSHDFTVNRQAEFPNREIGEVVAYNYQTPKSVLQAWKDSHKHNEALLNIDYKFIGISYATDEFDKKYICALLLN